MTTELASRLTLVDPINAAGASPSRWSDAIAQRYSLRLSPELVDWFDSGVCDGAGGGEFDEPVSPEVLLERAPEVVWPALMPPDLLPLVGNRLGDWLCAKIAANDTVGEIVYWYHGGGDWLPYGKSLPEAILFDVLADRLPGRRQRHAIPAASHPARRGELPIEQRPLVQWALQHLPTELRALLKADQDLDEIAPTLLRHEVAEIPVRCACVLTALESELRRRLTPMEAAEFGADWEYDAARWIFDPQRNLPDSVRDLLCQRWQLTPEQLTAQDWSAAQRHCDVMSVERPDLGWVHDIGGAAARRDGRMDLAASCFVRGAMSSVFTDQAIRFRTHFESDRAAKFSVANLIQMDRVDALPAAYLAAISGHGYGAGRGPWRDAIADYWLEQISQKQPDQATRYHWLMKAGWDVGCDSLEKYRSIFDPLIDAAEQSGQMARANVARSHRACLLQRYFIK